MKLGFWPPVYGNWIMTNRSDVSDASFEYTKRSTLAAEAAGFDTMLVAEHFIHPNGPELDLLDAWTTCAALAALTERIEIIAAVKPGLRAPGTIAKMATNIDHVSAGRFAINLVSAWWPPEYEMMGCPVLPHDERYARSREYAEIIRGLWTTSAFSYEGEHYSVKDATLAPPPVQRPHPTIYIGGESEAGRALGAHIADVFLINARPLDEMQPIVEDMKRRAASLDRVPLRFGMTGFVICRDTEQEAWREFERLVDLRHLVVKGADTEVEMLKTSPQIDRRVGTNGGTAAGFIGTPEQITERILAFRDIGMETFLLQFHPVLEEVQRFGEQIIPLLRDQR